MSTTTTEAQLPAGYDDKKSRWYLPPELREHYRPVSDHQVRALFSGTVLDFMGQGDLSGGAVAYARHLLDGSGEAAKIRKSYGRDTKGAHAATRRRVKVIAEGMSREDETWWAHYSIAVRSAQARYDRALAWENGGRQLWEAQHTCEVCGTVSSQVNASRPVNLRFNGGISGGVHVLACAKCRHLLPDVAADDVVDGRPRREVVAEWIAKNG